MAKPGLMVTETVRLPPTSTLDELKYSEELAAEAGTTAMAANITAANKKEITVFNCFMVALLN